MPADTEKLRRTLIHVVGMLVRGEYHNLEAATGGQRLKAGHIERAVQEWPARLVMPPDERLETLVYGEVLEVEGAHPPQCAIDVLLYTAEEGRSDLTLSLTLKDSPGPLYEVEIDDQHVP